MSKESFLNLKKGDDGVRIIEGSRGKLDIKAELPPESYVVSGDLFPLLRDWAYKYGFTLPPSKFFAKLREKFARYMKRIFPGFEFVREEELIKGINNLVSDLASELVSKKGLYPIILSLDSVYYPTNPSLEINRLVDKNGEDRGYGRRPGTLPLLKQFREIQKLKKELEEKSGNEDNKNSKSSL